MTTMREVVAAVTCVGKPKRIANNTYKYQRPDGAEVIRLHHTDIIVKRPDGKVELNTGGWKTPTTKGRFNDLTPYRVYSNRGAWKVYGDGGKEAPFYDGIVLPDAFENTAQATEQEKYERDMKKKIKEFVTRNIITGRPLPQPDNGDCWHCLMFDQEQPVGEAAFSGWRADKPVDRSQNRNTDHLLSHIEEDYLPGSLIVNAFRAAGYSDAGISFICYGRHVDYVRVRRTVSTYLKRRLGLATC